MICNMYRTIYGKIYNFAMSCATVAMAFNPFYWVQAIKKT